MKILILLSLTIIYLNAISFPHDLIQEKAMKLFNEYKLKHPTYVPYRRAKNVPSTSSLFSNPSSSQNNIKFFRPQEDLIELHKQVLYGLVRLSGTEMFGRFAEDGRFEHIHYDKNFTTFRVLKENGKPVETTQHHFQGKGLLMYIMDNLVRPGALGEQCMYSTQIVSNVINKNEYKSMSGASVYDRFTTSSNFIILGADIVSLRGEVGNYQINYKGNFTDDKKENVVIQSLNGKDLGYAII